MSERTAKLRLGGFVAAGFVGFAGLAMLFGGAPRVFDSRAQFTIVFSEAPGISPGTPVRKSGVRVGEVTALDLEENTGQVRVSILVDKKFLPRQNEEATIFRGILSGDTSLDFIPKVTADGLPVTTRGEAYAINSEIFGQTPINPNTLVRQASGVLPSAQESMVRILNSIERVEKVIPKVERAFDEIAELAKSGKEFVPELRETNKKVQSLISFNDPPANPKPDDKAEGTLRATLADIREFIKSTKPLVDDVRKIIKDNEADLGGTLKAVRKTAEGASDLLTEENRKAIAAIIKNIQTSSDELNRSLKVATLFLDSGEKTLKEVNARMPQVERTLAAAENAMKGAEGAIKNIETATKPLAENADQIVKNVNVTADQLAKTLAEVRETLRVLNRADGTLQKVLNDPMLYNQLNDSAVSLTRTLMRAEKIAADLQVFADKIARRPESLGIGGAIRPNAGLKEAPSASPHERPILPTPLSGIPPAGPVVPSYRPQLTPRTNDLPPK
jgi:phospholipid/cholesterol/gamma-HCH transport system substrate-binding protein